MNQIEQDKWNRIRKECDENVKNPPEKYSHKYVTRNEQGRPRWVFVP